MAALLLLTTLAVPTAFGQDTDPLADGDAETVEAIEDVAEPDDLDMVPEVMEPSYQGIEEITITGTQSQGGSDFEEADSVTAFNTEDLEALGAQSVKDLAGFTPNLEIVTTGSTTPTLFIRGVGLNDFNANAASAVVVSLDDVPQNSSGLQLGTIFDVERVNILRGPQGAGPSRNASAGAIKLYARKPTGDFGGFLSASYGNYDYLDVEGALEAPLYEDLVAARLAFRVTRRDGYMTNACGGQPPLQDRPFGDACRNTAVPEGLPTAVNNLNNWAARATIAWEPTLDMKWTFNGHGSRRDEDSRLGLSYGIAGRITFPDDTPPFGDNPTQNGYLGGLDADRFRKPEVSQMQDAAFNRLLIGAPCAPSCTPGQRNIIRGQANLEVADVLAEKLDIAPYTGYYDRVGPTLNDTWGGYIRGEMQLPKGISFTSITGYDAYDRLIDVDLDFSPNVLFEIETDDKIWQFTQDLRFDGEFSDDLPLSWEAGGFYIQEKLDVTITNDFGDQTSILVSKRDYTQQLWSFGIYGSLVWDISENFTLDGGVRYNWERKSMDYLLAGSGIVEKSTPSDTWSAPTGTVRLTYNFNEETSAFWKYTRGWKAGHFNATSSPTKGVTAARPETLDAFETGLRGSWLDNRLNLNLAIFYYNYRDYQLFVVENDFDSLPGFVIINANDAEQYGADIEMTTNPWEGGFADVRVGWLESQFLDFTQQQVVQQQIQRPGQPLDFVTFVKELDNTGNRLLNSPEFTVSITAGQRVELGRFGSVTARYDGAWKDDTYFDATEGRGTPNQQNVEILPPNTIGQAAYWLHNVRLTYTVPEGNIEIAGWVRNVSDKAYKTFAFDVTTFQNTTIYFLGEPRMFGMTVNVHF